MFLSLDLFLEMENWGIVLILGTVATMSIVCFLLSCRYQLVVATTFMDTIVSSRVFCEA